MSRGLMATLPGVSVGNYNRISALSVMGSAGNEMSYMQDGILSNSVKAEAPTPTWIATAPKRFRR